MSDIGLKEISIKYEKYPKKFSEFLLAIFAFKIFIIVELIISICSMVSLSHNCEPYLFQSYILI
jgi:hypothetical protein